MSVRKARPLPTDVPIGTSSYRGFAELRRISRSPVTPEVYGRPRITATTGYSFLNMGHPERPIFGMNPRPTAPASTSRSGTAIQPRTKPTPFEAFGEGRSFEGASLKLPQFEISVPM